MMSTLRLAAVMAFSTCAIVALNANSRSHVALLSEKDQMATVGGGSCSFDWGMTDCWASTPEFSTACNKNIHGQDNDPECVRPDPENYPTLWQCKNHSIRDGVVDTQTCVWAEYGTGSYEHSTEAEEWPCFSLTRCGGGCVLTPDGVKLVHKCPEPDETPFHWHLIDTTLCEGEDCS